MRATSFLNPDDVCKSYQKARILASWDETLKMRQRRKVAALASQMHEWRRRAIRAFVPYSWTAAPDAQKYGAHSAAQARLTSVWDMLYWRECCSGADSTPRYEKRGHIFSPSGKYTEVLIFVV